MLAEHQTAGRGRLGRSWSDTPGQNLLFSLVLRPTLPPDRLALVTLAAGVAVAEAVATFTAPHEPALKWPNDVLLEGRKTCGMLLEGRLGGGAPCVVLGIGLNVNQTHFPPDLDGLATSLSLAAGRPIPRAPLLAALLARLEARYDSLLRGRTDEVRQAFLDRMAFLGVPVSVVPAAGGSALTGTIEGIAESGGLLLRTSGGLHTLHAGDVSLRPLPQPIP